MVPTLLPEYGISRGRRSDAGSRASVRAQRWREEDDVKGESASGHKAQEAGSHSCLWMGWRESR